ncbi:asparagine synthase (glutamine-hydrolyzing) [Limnobacter sp.]|uniref:asparagine synthase (glutamine-hydrolyzing) n=1 Tax=Limnobacter sp. TaxID=2003368 RepID=UPI002FE160F5
MCGIVGFISAKTPVKFDINESLEKMCQALKNRGPDAGGAWVDNTYGVGLGHRRLAILDVSPAGSQPMTSSNGRYVLAFNGEIYNHRELRKSLSSLELSRFKSSKLENYDIIWNGQSDTETILACIERWGIKTTLEKANGMFAIALWDRANCSLTLARDKFGEKPLYYGWQGKGSESVFLFGSELSALKCHPVFESNINRDSVSLFMRHNCVGGENSIYSGIQKLQPGHYLTVSNKSHTLEPKAWWSLSNIIMQGVRQPFLGSLEDATNKLEELLNNAVSMQMIADVPLGAFLSGGVDSSTIVALMQAQSSRPVRTFSIGFHEIGYNEAEHAKAVASHLGTDHTELYITPEQALAVIPQLPSLYSEPFADSSQIPTYLVSHLARQHVTVSLSGDAGDELFCGYTRYQVTARLWGKISCLPGPLRKIAAWLIKSFPPHSWDKLGRLLSVSRAGDKLHKGADLLNSASVNELYKGMVSHWSDPASLVIGSTEPATALTNSLDALKELGDVERMMALDMLTYLTDDILVKVDRAAMGVSLETRVPFLDHNVVEFAWSLPLEYKLRNGVTKWPLRQVLYRHVPQKLIERPKMGFGVPIDQWLRGPLRDWAESLLSDSRLRADGFFRPEPIRQKWQEHLSGQRNWQNHLWSVLMFQAWLEHQND